MKVYYIGFLTMYCGLQIDGKQYKNLTHHCLGFLQSGTEYTRGVFMEQAWINNTKQQKMAGQSKIKCDKNVASFM
jgi:hypothetical protein